MKSRIDQYREDIARIDEELNAYEHEGFSMIRISAGGVKTDITEAYIAQLKHSRANLAEIAEAKS